jgi:hypothetical protein
MTALQFEEGVGDLEHEDVWVAVVMDDKDTFDCATHAIVLVIVLETLETGRDRGILLGLGLLGAGQRMSGTLYGETIHT